MEAEMGIVTSIRFWDQGAGIDLLGGLFLEW